MFGTSNRSVGVSLEKRTNHCRGPEGIRIPVHTQSATNTTTTTISSLFAKSSQSASQIAVSANRQPCNTQIVYSACQPSHQGHHLRVIHPGSNPLVRAPSGPSLKSQLPRGRESCLQG